MRSVPRPSPTMVAQMPVPEGLVPTSLPHQLDGSKLTTPALLLIREMIPLMASRAPVEMADSTAPANPESRSEARFPARAEATSIGFGMPSTARTATALTRSGDSRSAPPTLLPAGMTPRRVGRPAPGRGGPG